MQNLYTKNFSENNENKLSPKKSTIDFLLNYSKALSVISHQSGKFEILLN